MTVSSATPRNDYIGSGISGPYAFTFAMQSASHLKVIRRDLTTGGETTLVSGTDYTLAGTAWPNGGSITLTATLSSGYALALMRVVPLTQLVDLRNQGAFFAEVHESEFDLLAQADQQQQDAIDRSLQFPQSEAGTALARTLPAAALRANKSLGFDASGNIAVITSAVSSIADVSLVQVVDTVAALKALAIPAGSVQYLVRGYAAAGDGGGGIFRWNASDATADNLGTVIIPNSAPGTGRWNRVYEIAFGNAKEFGAAGNGSTDDRAIFASLDAMAVALNRIVVVPAGTYRIASNITLAGTYMFSPGAVLKPDAAVTVTYNGSLIAGAQQIFDVSVGTVTGSIKCDEVNCRWFGTVGNGVANDAAAIQASINAAVSAGRPLFIPAGVYECGSTGLTIGGALRIRGAGSLSSRLVRSANVATPLINANGITGIQVEDLWLEYTPGATTASNSHSALYLQTCTNVLVRNVRSTGQFYVGIQIEACIKAKVESCEVRGANNRGLYAYLGCNDIIFQGNFVDGAIVGGSTKTTSYGININPGGGTSITRITVQGNTVKNCAVHGIACSERTYGCSIVGNTVTDISFYGILVQKANTFQGQQCTVSGNSVANCANYGIYISESVYCTVTANIVNNSTSHGIYLWESSNNVVQGNICYANGGDGLEVASNSSRNLLIANQSVGNTGKGLVIAAANCFYTRYNDNYFYNNTGGTVTDSGTGSSPGTNLTT